MSTRRKSAGDVRDTPIAFSSARGIAIRRLPATLSRVMSSNGIPTAAISLAIMVAIFDGAAITGFVASGLERIASPTTLILGTMAGLAVMTIRTTRG